MCILSSIVLGMKRRSHVLPFRLLVISRNVIVDCQLTISIRSSTQFMQSHKNRKLGTFLVYS